MSKRRCQSWAFASLILATGSSTPALKITASRLPYDLEISNASSVVEAWQTSPVTQRMVSGYLVLKGFKDDVSRAMAMTFAPGVRVRRCSVMAYPKPLEAPVTMTVGLVMSEEC